ncbi:hypothetical protein SUGI_0484230 [Cryptomeria japonica]|nr:hypothetical protein SUGI_0484230 [Cryptomeria japonica]
MSNTKEFQCRGHIMSITDVELQEIRGFIQLGFQFNKDQLSPRLVNVVPGLKNLIITTHEGLPSPNEEKGEVMKERLKLWARSVASTVNRF